MLANTQKNIIASRENRDLAREMLSPYADKIQILTEYRVRSVTMDGDRIVSILLENAETDEFGIPAPRTDFRQNRRCQRARLH